MIRSSTGGTARARPTVTSLTRPAASLWLPITWRSSALTSPASHGQRWSTRWLPRYVRRSPAVAPTRMTGMSIERCTSYTEGGGAWGPGAVGGAGSSLAAAGLVCPPRVARVETLATISAWFFHDLRMVMPAPPHLDG